MNFRQFIPNCDLDVKRLNRQTLIQVVYIQTAKIHLNELTKVNLFHGLLHFKV